MVLLAIVFLSASCSDDPTAQPVVPDPNIIALQSGLVAHFPLDGDAKDASGKGHDGTVNGAVLHSDRHDQPNKAYRFKGLNQTITTDYQGILGSAPRTVAYWILTTATGHNYHVSWGKSAPGQNFVCAANYPSNPSGAQSEIGWSYRLYTSNIANGAWHHMAYIVPNMPNPTMADVKIYQDGVMLTAIGGEVSPGSPIDTQSDGSWNLMIGTNNHDADFVIDDVRVYDRALSEAELIRLYNL